MNKSFFELFNEYFEMVPAQTEELKHEVYKLRYQVYCTETGFEDPNDHPEGIEIDEYDEISIHYLIKHRKSQLYAATTRLILPQLSEFENQFPIEKYTQIDDVKIIGTIPRESIAEASRFCVSKDFKRRKNESGTITGISTVVESSSAEDERRVIPHITIGLYACLMEMSYKNNIDYWYAVMEPALVRFFTSLGIHFQEIGPLCEYHGKRKPYIIKIADLLNGCYLKNPEYWNLITHQGKFDKWTDVFN